MNEMINNFLDNAEKALHALSNYVGLAEIRKARKQLTEGNAKGAVKTCMGIFDYITGSEIKCNVNFIHKAEYHQMMEGIKAYILIKEEDERYAVKKN